MPRRPVLGCDQPRGVKLSAARIEEILEALPNIKEAAVCGSRRPLGA